MKNDALNYAPTLPYPDAERPMLALLEALFRDWHQHFASVGWAFEKHRADDMVFDGFYPYYFSQKKRLLFIGWESRQISGCNYLDLLYKAYRVDKTIGSQPLNANCFHYRMLCIAYGILNGMPVWQEIPDATVIGDTFGTIKGLSFAFLNISKFSNESDNRSCDWPVVRAAHEHSTKGRNFISEEIAVLKPHIIITMRLEGMLTSLGELRPILASEAVNAFWLDNGDHRALLLDTWHFAANKKGDIADYYDPICDAVRSSEGPHVA